MSAQTSRTAVTSPLHVLHHRVVESLFSGAADTQAVAPDHGAVLLHGRDITQIDEIAGITPVKSVVLQPALADTFLSK